MTALTKPEFSFEPNRSQLKSHPVKTVFKQPTLSSIHLFQTPVKLLQAFAQARPSEPELNPSPYKSSFNFSLNFTLDLTQSQLHRASQT